MPLNSTHKLRLFAAHEYFYYAFACVATACTACLGTVRVQRDQCGKPWRSRLTTNSTTSSASSTSTVSANRSPPLCSTTSKRTGNARKRSGKHDACVRARSHHTRSPSDHHTIHRSLTVTGPIRVYSRQPCAW